MATKLPKLSDGVLRYPQFYWACICEAANGSLEQASLFAFLFGGIVLWAIVVIRGMTDQKMPTTGHWGEFAAFTAEMGLLSVGIAWLIVFVFRLLGAPTRLYSRLQATIPPLPESDMKLFLHDGLISTSGLKDENDKELPANRAFLVRVENIGEKFLRNCQLTFGQLPAWSHCASKQFDLRRGEHRDVPVLFVPQDRDGRGERSHLYHRTQAGEISANGPALLVGPGIYDLRVLSEDSCPGLIQVSVSADLERKSGKWSNWRMIECH